MFLLWSSGSLGLWISLGSQPVLRAGSLMAPTASGSADVCCPSLTLMFLLCMFMPSDLEGVPWGSDAGLASVFKNADLASDGVKSLCQWCGPVYGEEERKGIWSHAEQEQALLGSDVVIREG